MTPTHKHRQTIGQKRAFYSMIAKIIRTSGFDPPALGERIHVHYEDGPYMVTANYVEAWVTQEVIEQIQDWFDDLGFHVEVDMMSSCEIGVLGL